MNMERAMDILLQVVMILFFYWLITRHYLTESSGFTKFLTFLLMFEITVVKDYFTTGSFTNLGTNVILVYAAIFLLKYIIVVPTNHKQK
jgi:hypothetical protein